MATIVSSILDLAEKQRAFADTIGARPFSLVFREIRNSGESPTDPDGYTTSIDTLVLQDGKNPKIRFTQSQQAFPNTSSQSKFCEVTLTPKHATGGWEFPSVQTNSTTQWIIFGPGMPETGMVFALQSHKETATKITLLLKSSGQVST